MPVSGVLISCAEGAAPDVSRKIADIGGVEVHGVIQDNRIVAVVEGETVDDEVARVTELQHLEGVLSVSLAYHNFEDDEP